MSQKVQAKDLVSCLSVVKAFISEGAALLPAYRRMAFSKRTVLGQNGSAGILAKSLLEAPAAGASLDGSRLLRFAELVGDADLSCEFSGNRLIVNGGGAKASFAIAGIEDVPLPAWPKKGELRLAPETLLEASRAILFSGDQSGNAGPLSSVCFLKTGVMSTDAARATYVPVSGLKLDDGQQILVPSSLISILPAFEGPMLWGPSGGFLWFEWPGFRVWLRTIEQEFPDLSPVFRKAAVLSKSPKASLEYDPAAMSVAVETAASAGGSGLSCVAKGRTLSISCKGELVEANLEREISGSGAAAFSVSAQKFQDAVQRYGKLTVCGEGLLLFEGNGARHILMELIDEAKGETEK